MNTSNIRVQRSQSCDLQRHIDNVIPFISGEQGKYDILTHDRAPVVAVRATHDTLSLNSDQRGYADKGVQSLLRCAVMSFSTLLHPDAFAMRCYVPNTGVNTYGAIDPDYGIVHEKYSSRFNERLLNREKIHDAWKRAKFNLLLDTHSWANYLIGPSSQNAAFNEFSKAAGLNVVNADLGDDAYDAYIGARTSNYALIQFLDRFSQNLFSVGAEPYRVASANNATFSVAALTMTLKLPNYTDFHFEVIVDAFAYKLLVTANALIKPVKV